MIVHLTESVYFLLAVSTYVSGIDVDFNDKLDGFFIKSPYHKYKRAEPTVVKEALILTHPAEVYKLRASYGPFEKYQAVPNDFLTSFRKYQEDDDDSRNFMHHQIAHNMDISAHLVNPAISKSNPVVQILVHAKPLNKKKHEEFLFKYYGHVHHWCAQVFVSRANEQFSSVCVLNDQTNACVAGISIPDDWWLSKNNTNKREKIEVSYDITRVEENHECASISNTIIPARAELPAAAVNKKLISEVNLLNEKLSYVDSFSQDLIFRIPQSDLKSNSEFEVSVLLEKNSAFKEFVIQVTVRGGIEIEGASTETDSPWNVIFEAGPTKESAIITAIIKENLKYSKSFRQEEIMRWQFRVSSETSVSPVARISWSVDFERNGLARNSLYSPEIAKVTAKFNIISGQPEHLTAVLKERNILNTAMLTGNAVVHDLRIYLVSHDNTYLDVTQKAKCRSSDIGVIKVTENCAKVYLDGSEVRGSQNATIFAEMTHERSAHYTTSINIQVWIPEHKLDIQLSDSRLSQVKGWKVKTRTDRVSKRSVDLGKLFPWANQVSPVEDCVNKYQQSMIDVYSRFIIQPPGENLKYFRNRKIYMRVTDLIKNRLHVRDSSIATIKGNTVNGLSPGRTEIQVVSPNGKLMGAKEIRVGKDKVEIERLMVRVISGMSLTISEDRNPGALLATVSVKDLLVAKQQEAVLDIAVEFNDNTLLPLTSIDPAEFDLEVISMNPDVVEVADFVSSSNLPPSIRAVGNGKGDIIKVTLQEGDSCYRKKVKSLDTEYVHVQVDFDKEIDFDNSVQSDGNDVWYGRSDGRSAKNDYFNPLKGPYYNKKKDKAKETDKKFKVYLNKAEEEKVKSKVKSDKESPPKSEALQQPVDTAAKHPSPLEIGMYVLIAVFIFAILVFTANCAVFMVRYQRKRSPKGIQRVKTASISQAPDWVWIGRATLERSGASNSGCNQALMAEEDFNGNQMVVPNSHSISGSSHSSGRTLRGETQKSDSNHRAGSTSGASGSSNRDSMVSTYEGSECSIRITANPLHDESMHDDDSGMGYNEAEWDYEAMGMTYEQLMDYFDNLKESSA